MDKDIARHVLRVTFHSWGLITDLIPLLKQHCTPEEYESFKKAIGAISGDFSTEMLKTVFNAFPELEKEVDDKIKKYGKLI
jgi:hypothetical protein